MSFIILIFAFILAHKKPIYALLLYGVLAADGISGFFSLSFPYFQLVLEMCLLYTFYRSYIENKRKTNEEKLCSKVVLCIIISMFLSLLLAAAFKPSVNLASYFLTGIGGYGSIALGIWINGRKTVKNPLKLLFYFVLVQNVISFCILYAPLWGIDLFDPINGSNYLSEGGEYYQDEESLATTSNFYEILLQKGRFFRCGQFGNANVLGIYAGAGIILSIIMMLQKKANESMKMKLLMTLSYIVVILFSAFLWTNAGERAILYAIFLMLAYGAFFKMSKNFWGMSFRIICIIFVFVVLVGSDLFNYLFGSGVGNSVNSRLFLFKTGMQSLLDNPLYGSAGELITMNGAAVFPHISFLRAACLYGFPVGLLTLYIHLLRPVGLILKNRIYGLSTIDFGLVIFAFACFYSNAFAGAIVSLGCLAEFLSNNKSKQ